MTITRSNYPSVAAGLNLATFPADLKVSYDLIEEYNPGYTDWVTFFDTPEGLEVQNLYFQKLSEYLDSLSAPPVVPPAPPVVPANPVVPVVPVTPPAPPVGTPTNVVYEIIPIGTVPAGGGAVVGIVSTSPLPPVATAPAPSTTTPGATTPGATTTPAPGATNLTVTVTPPATDDTATGKKWIPYVLGGVGLLVLLVVVGYVWRQRRS